MAKTNAALVIVESPAKAKTIEKYLGKEYKVTASALKVDKSLKSGASYGLKAGNDKRIVLHLANGYRAGSVSALRGEKRLAYVVEVYLS